MDKGLEYGEQENKHLIPEVVYAAPTLGIMGAIFIISLSLLYLNHARHKAARNGEGYFGSGNGQSSVEIEVLDFRNLGFLTLFIGVTSFVVLFIIWSNKPARIHFDDKEIGRKAISEK
ncbi:hypothetical protein [Peribacillus simplex]|uniref:hypothetical protein n=1 Tax=Peribacillus simplex TaxID=1478 RepID=UPI00366E1E0F